MEQNKNFPIRLKAAIMKRMNETGISDRLLKAAKHWDDYDQSERAFIESLGDITLDQLQGVKAEQPSPSPMEVALNEALLQEIQDTVPLETDENPLFTVLEMRWILIEYLKRIQLPPASSGETMRWVKGEYERLYAQVKGGKRTVCYVDYRWNPDDEPMRDICTIKPTSKDMELSSRGHGYNAIWNPAYDDKSTEVEKFIKMCQFSNVEWLDESASPSDTREEAIKFGEWFFQNKWSKDKEHQKLLSVVEMYDLYTQSLNK